MTVCSAMVWSVISLFIADDLSGTKTQIGLIYMLSGAIGVIFGPSLGRISDRVGRRPVLLSSMACFTLYFVLCFFARNVLDMFLIALLEGVGWMTLGSTGPALVADIVPAKERGWAMGMYNRTTGVGWMMGPAVGGFLADAIGFRSTFLLSTGLMISGLLMASLFIRKPEKRG